MVNARALVVLGSCLSCAPTPAATPATPAPAQGQQVAIAESEPSPTAEAVPSGPRPRSSLPEDVLRDLYTCWFDRPYEYMFSPPLDQRPGRGDPPASKKPGVFMAGVGGVMHYGSLSRCFGELIEVKKTSYSALNTVEQFAGTPVGIPGAQWRDPMAINVEIVRWGRASLIPDPNMIVFEGISAGELYRDVFSRFFRLMAHSYIELRTQGDVSTEGQDYFRAARSGRDGLEYLENKYAGRLAGYGGSWDGTQWTPAMSFGFWLRREQDGSADELWHGLLELLELYDPMWLADMRKQHGPSAPQIFEH